jgi:predicted phosphate transport protein (TIGR00153 family)
MISSLLKIFGRSPIAPLEEHMRKVHSCVEQLEPFFAEVIAHNWTEAARIQQLIIELENHADKMKRQLRLHLPNSLFMPLDRADLLELLTAQDRLANISKDISGLVIGRRLELPTTIADEFIVFLANCVKTSEEASVAIHELDKLLETIFSGAEVRLVEKILSNIWHIERATDIMQINLRQKIYELEHSLNPVNLIFIYQVVSKIGQIANYAQDVGDRLQILLAH